MELNILKSQTTWNDAASRINSNNLKIGTELSKLGNATYKNKGYFKTLEALQAAYPTASLGSKAYVGQTYPYTVYWWTGEWETEGETGGNESVPLGDYYTKEDVLAILNDFCSVEDAEGVVEDYHVILTESEYEDLALKQEKLYLCYEDEDE